MSLEREEGGHSKVLRFPRLRRFSSWYETSRWVVPLPASGAAVGGAGDGLAGEAVICFPIYSCDDRIAGEMADIVEASVARALRRKEI